MFCVSLPPTIVFAIGLAAFWQLVKVLTIGEAYTFDGPRCLVLKNSNVIGSLEHTGAYVSSYRHTVYTVNVSVWNGAKYKTVAVDHHLSEKFADSVANEINRVARWTQARLPAKSGFLVPVEGFSDQEQEFAIGDIVIWRREQLPLGEFRGPQATVLGKTEKRVKIEVVENGQSQVKYVKPEKLILKKFTEEK